MRDRLWFFGSAYFDRNHAGGGISTSGASLTPTPDGLATLQSSFGNAPGVVALVNQGPYSIKTGNPHVFPGSTTTQDVTYNGKTVPVEFGEGAASAEPAAAVDAEPCDWITFAWACFNCACAWSPDQTNQ